MVTLHYVSELSSVFNKEFAEMEHVRFQSVIGSIQFLQQVVGVEDGQTESFLGMVVNVITGLIKCSSRSTRPFTHEVVIPHGTTADGRTTRPNLEAVSFLTDAIPTSTRNLECFNVVHINTHLEGAEPCPAGCNTI